MRFQAQSSLFWAEIDRFSPKMGRFRAYSTLERSISRFGPRMPIEVDQNGRIINGNTRMQIYADLEPRPGIDPEWQIRMVDAPPGTVLVVKYPDFDILDPKNPARAYQIAALRAENLAWKDDRDFPAWDFANLVKHAKSSDLVDLDEHFWPSELKKEALKWAKSENLGKNLQKESDESSSSKPKKICPCCARAYD